MYPYIKIFSLALPSYGICMLLGYALVYVLALIRSKRKYKPLQWEDLLAVTSAVLCSALLGGYILYMIVTYPKELLSGDFSVLTQGGVVFYGALFGGVAGALIAIKILKINISVFEASVVPFIPLGHAVGRIGCALAGCCYGMEYYGPFAIYYPADNPLYYFNPTVGHFPVQFLEAILDVVIMIILLIFLRKNRRKFDTVFLYLALYSVMRFCTEMLRGDEIRGVYEFNISTSQWISIGLIVICILRLVIKPKR